MGTTNIATNATTVVKPALGKLRKIVVNKAVANATISLFDNATTGSGPSLGVITLPATVANPFTLDYGDGAMFNAGLTIVTSAATDITVVYE